MSAGAYSLALAGMTALQSRADAALAGDRTPMVQTLDAIAADHDELERAVSAAVSEYDRLAGTYDGLGATFSDVEDRLDVLAGMASSISHTASSLPSRVSLPSVRSATRSVTPPRTQATTGASG